MKKLMFIVALVCFKSIGIAQTKQSITQFTVTYKVKHLGFNSTGKFDNLTGTIFFDEKHLNSSTISVAIEAKSFDSGNDLRDNDLKSTNYFDAVQYPEILMKSVSFSHVNGNNYVGEFNLTLKGVTKKIELPFIFTQNGSINKFSGNFKINRTDFNVGSSSMMLSDDVPVFITIETAVK